MGNLIRTQQTSQIGNARASKKVSKCTLEEMKTKLKYIFKLIGLVKIPDEVEKSILIDFIKNDMKQFRIEEFTLAFKMMVRGDFTVGDHFQNFSVKYLCTVMNAYSDSEKRKKHLQDERLKELPMSATISDSEKQKIVEQGIKQAFEKYKETRVLPTPCAWMYQQLEDSGDIVHSLEEKNIFYTQAQQKEDNRLEALKKTSDFLGIKEILREQQNQDKNKLKNIAREIALKSYWDEMIMTEQL